TAHTFAITTGPAHGEAVGNAQGRVRVCTAPGYVGDDEVTVRITDSADASRAPDVTIAVEAHAGDGPAACSLEFEDDGGGGCCGAGSRSPSGTAALLALVGLVTLRRRRR